MAREAAALDDEAELARYTHFVSRPEGGQQACSQLVLDGIHCAACAGIIEQAVRQVPGVQQVSVQAASRRAQVWWDPAATRASQVVQAIERAGYQAFPDTATDQRAADRREARKGLWRLFVAGFCMMQVMMYATPTYVATPEDIGLDVMRMLLWASWLLSLPVVLFSATPFYAGAWRALRQRRIGMDVPVALGILVTFVASSGATFATLASGEPSIWGQEVYFDSLTMFVAFLLAGRALEARARRQATQALDSVLHRLPQSVERLTAEGSERISPVRLQLGDEVRVAAGQAFPADGSLLDGPTEVDEALLTGESRPLPRRAGESVLAGSYNLTSPVRMRVERLGEQTQYQRIVWLMQQAMAERPSWVRLADRIAGPFLWAVLLLAIGAGIAWWFIDPSRAVWVAVAVLIVTCPCALSLAAPSAMVAAAGALARRSVLVQRFDALEALSRADAVVFDKTGTLTDDRLRLSGVRLPAGGDETAMLAQAASLAVHSRHPLSLALAAACEQPAAVAWQGLREQPGSGIEARDETGALWRLGAADWAAGPAADPLAKGADPDASGRADAGRPVGEPAAEQERVWLTRDGVLQAAFALDEQLRPDAASAVAALRAQGLRVSLLSGDQPGRVAAMGQRLGLVDGQWQARARPQDKLEAVAAAQASGHTVVVVGDGINDAPVLSRADVSFAMGHGAALAQSRADFIVLGSRPADIVAAWHLSRRTMRIVRQNLAWAAIYNAASVPLALIGWLPPWLAGLGMALSSLIVVGNAVRLARSPADPHPAPPSPTGAAQAAHG
jgi:Cu2+-exporting ATPase